MKIRNILFTIALFFMSLAIGLVIQTTSVAPSANAVSGGSTSSQKNIGIPWLPSQPSDYGDRVSVSEASTRLLFALPQATHLPNNEALTDVYVSPSSVQQDQRQVILQYSSGLLVEAAPVTTRVGWDSALGKPGTPFKTVSVNGLPALAAEPGDETIEGLGVWHRPGSIMWQNGKVLYTIYGEYPIKDLMGIAESIR